MPLALTLKFHKSKWNSKLILNIYHKNALYVLIIKICNSMHSNS